MRPLNIEKFLPWFYGYTENIDGLPTLEQWKRVCEMIDRVGLKYTADEDNCAAAEMFRLEQARIEAELLSK